MENRKSLAITIISQALALAINLGIGFFVSSYIVSRINAAAYGFVGLANDFVGYAQVLTVALNSMAGRFITVELHKKQMDQANRYFTSVTVANCALGAMLLIPFIIIIVFMSRLVNIAPDILPDVQLLWTLLFANFIISIVITTFQVATFVRDKLYLTGAVQIVGNLLRLFIIVIAYTLFKPAVWYLGLALLVSAGFGLISHIRYTKKLTPELQVRRRYFEWKSIRTILASGFWNSITRLSGIMATGLDLLITNKFVGATAMGLVSVSKTVPNMILQFMGTAASAFAPRLTKSFAQQGFDDMAQQTFFSVRLLGIIAGIPMAFLIVFGKAFFSLWMPTLDAELLYWLSLLGCLAFTFSMPLEGIWNVFTASNKVRVSSVYLLANSAVSVALVFALLPITQDINTRLYIIVGVSSVFSVIRALTFLPLYGAHCLKQKWYVFYPHMLKNLAYTALLVLMAFGISRILLLDSWLKFFATVCLFGVISLPIGFILLLKKNERKAVTSMIGKVFKHGKDQ